MPGYNYNLWDDPVELERMNRHMKEMARQLVWGDAQKPQDLWPDMTNMIDQALEARKETVTNQISKLEEELKIMNTYEKTVIRNYMNIEYGPGSSIEQLTNAYGYFGSIAKFVKEAGYEVSKDLEAVVDACKRDLDIKIRENRLKELRALEIQRTQYVTRSERLTNIDSEIARLKELTK